MAYEHGTTTKRLPSWMRRPLAVTGEFDAVAGLVSSLGLRTVCAEAKCPNRGECYAAGTATFLVAGDACTRGCRFCAVETRSPAPLDPDEPDRVAEAVAQLGLAHAVITMVTRDDLADGASTHIARTIAAVRRRSPATKVEVLVSDFGGDLDAVGTVMAAGPDVFNHNLETVPRLYASVRPGARYERSLDVLAVAKERSPGLPTKSGMMLGLGETPDEVLAVMDDLRRVGCDLLTLGQYLRPSKDHLPVAEFVSPDMFTAYAREAYRRGFAGVASAPFVRSSYHARDLAGGDVSARTEGL